MPDELTDEGQPAQVPTKDQETKSPPPALESPPPSVASAGETEKNWWARVKPFVQCAGVVLLAIYTGFTVAMYFANKRSADAARSAADTANESLHISERAYLILGIPVDDFQHKRTDIPIINSGHIPSGIAKVVVHEATFRLDDPSEKILPFTAVIERHWREATYQTIPVVPTGNLISVQVDLPALVQDQIASGKQAITIAASVTYNDGFPDTPEQTYLFCDQSSYAQSTKLFLMRPCDDASVILQKLAAFDNYPSPDYQEK
ncbi:MAG: hypothetical protein WA020_03875 [Candidatus Acidiferrales bacterium]